MIGEKCPAAPGWNREVVSQKVHFHDWDLLPVQDDLHDKQGQVPETRANLDPQIAARKGSLAITALSSQAEIANNRQVIRPVNGPKASETAGRGPDNALLER